LACALSAATAQQMTINSATQTFEKRLAAANQTRTAEATKVNAAYGDALRRLNAEHAIRIQGALRTATGDEAKALEAKLATLKAPEAAAMAVASGSGGDFIGNADFDRIFESLAGKWNSGESRSYRSTASGGSEVESTSQTIFEFKAPKMLALAYKRTAGGNTSESKGNVYKAKLRDGKIVFENTTPRRSSSYTQWYELSIPFDPTNPTIISCEERKDSTAEYYYKLTRAEKK